MPAMSASSIHAHQAVTSTAAKAPNAKTSAAITATRLFRCRGRSELSAIDAP
jgi:hypothetical protein